MDDSRDLLELARHAAAAAGRELRQAPAEWSAVRATQGREVQIEADLRAEERLLAILTAESPWPVLSEECGWSGSADPRGRVWVVDPLDGSVNFRRGLPHCAVSVALVEGGRPVLGVVDCFRLGAVYRGGEGLGARCGDAPLAVSEASERAAAVLATGLPSRLERSATGVPASLADLASWGKVRMLGSAACSLALVAAGQVDAYREDGIMLWDVAAGSAIVRAAGGQVGMTGERMDAPMAVWAAGAGLADAARSPRS